jgi:thiamine-monophosphate kinase
MSEETGELSLVRRIREIVGAPARSTVVGIGDDAAVFEPSGELTLFTCDAFVDGVHFRREFASYVEIGSKCMTANVSDVAAMGGFPSKAAVSVCVPETVTESDIAELYEGMLGCARRHGVEIVGGDVVSSPEALVISVALLGSVVRERVVTRAGAVAGDALLVTGSLGGSEAGLRCLVAGLPEEGLVREARRRHLAPEARIAEAQALIDVATPRAMIDVSDGLSADVLHIAEESGVGVRLWAEKIPLAQCAVDVAARLGAEPLELALASGEEFELLVAIPMSETERTAEHVSAVTGTDVTLIGEVVDASEGNVLVRPDGVSEPLRRTGYEHRIRSGGGEGER